MFHMMTVSLRDRLSHAPLVVNSPRTLDTSCMVFTRKPIPSYGMGGVWGVEGGARTPVHVWVSTETGYWLSCLEM